MTREIIKSETGACQLKQVDGYWYVKVKGDKTWYKLSYLRGYCCENEKDS